MFSDFKGKFKGQTVWIVGTGSSLLHLKLADIGEGPIIALSQRY